MAHVSPVNIHIARYHHYPWVYVFRFLQASYSLQSGSSLDSHAATQNLRSTATLAHQQSDKAVYVAACLMEAMAHFKSSTSESIENIQRAIARAWAYQLEPGASMPQLLGLTHILDVACSLREGNNPSQMIIKLRAMQAMMDETLQNPLWHDTSDVIFIPINHTQTRNSGPLITQDTRMILGIGDDGRPNLVMSFLNKRDAYALS